MIDENSKQLHKVEDKCLRDAPPPCSNNCPAGVDSRAMAAAIQNGDFSAAYKLFSGSVPFTRIISETCAAECESACVLNELSGSVKISGLEKSCVLFGYKKNVLNKAFLPKKSESVAVVGAGLGGLTAAYYLRRKGFITDIYEKSGVIGGKLIAMIPEDTINADLSIVKELGANIIFNTEINDFSELCEKYNAVYVSTGNTYDFNIDEKTLHVKDNLFAGGSGRKGDYSSVLSLADGKCAATSIERYLQGVSLTAERFKDNAVTKVNTAGIKVEPPVEAAGGSYTKDEAILESERCLLCRCDECIKGCSYLAHYNTDPKKFIREVRNCLAISVGNRYANEAVNSCAECGFCEAVCPVGLNTGDVCAEAKKKMVETNKMPPSAHYFALNDMEHSNGEDYFLFKHQPGFEKSEYVFFPGCQLGSTAPDIVKKTYADLSERLNGGVGLMLGCCGAIGKWAARENLFNKALEKIKTAWREMREPKVITACPTCYSIFNEYISEMNVTGIWDTLNEIGLPSNVDANVTLAIHDACTTRNNENIHESIRTLLNKAGVKIVEPTYTKEITTCCGYGGLTGFTNRAVSDKIASDRASQSPYDFIAYCVNCRDRFMANGKKAYHMLELIYGGYDDKIRKFGWSERREGRERLKRELLKALWGENVEQNDKIAITLDSVVAELIETRMILKEDIISVIENAEATGAKLLNRNTGVFIASSKIGSVTFWVWYTRSDGGYTVHNAYSHRMIIEGM